MAKTLVAVVDLSDTILDRRLIELTPGGFNTRASAQVNRKPFLLPIERVGFEPFNSVLQKRTGPVDDVQPAKVVETYIVVDKTAQELDDEKSDRADDEINLLIQKAVAAEVWIRDEELVDVINAIIVESSLTTSQITKLTASDFRTRIKNRYKSFL